MLVGYARVSATHQNLDRQLALLKKAGCKRVFREKLSGREGMRRPELEKAIEALGTGDVLVLAEWDRATRSMLDGIRIIERVAARGATFKALDRQWLDLTTPLGKGILAFLSALAEDERSRILARANGGRAAAKKRGVGHDVLHTRPDTDGKAEMIDWRLHDLLAEDTLELVQKCFAPLAVELRGPGCGRGPPPPAAPRRQTRRSSSRMTRAAWPRCRRRR